MSPTDNVQMRFDHVSIAVRSIDRAVEFFSRYFPLKERNPRTRDDQVSGAFYWQDFWLGGFVVEFIEDLPNEPGFVSRFIEKHGEGMHHLSIEVNHLDPVIAKLKGGGVRVVDEQKYPSGSATAFISPRSAFGALIQFWQVPDFDAPHPKPAPDGLVHFDHVSIAVHDIRKAGEFFSTYFTPTAPGRDPHVSNSEGNFMIGNMQVAGFKLEFIQSPPEKVGNDFVAKFISRYGEGMHHISLDLKEFDGTLERLKRDGVRVVDEKRNRRGERQFFISPRDAFGVLVQVWDGL
ncbi:MAG: VOC family protein [Candidatus Binataceae bacterium]